MSCTLIALHHGRKTKNKSFASCRGRVNISGSSKIAWINVEFNGNSLSVAVPSKVKSVCGPVRLLLFLRDKFVVRRQFRFRKNRNCSLAWESICYGDKILLMIYNDHKQCIWHFSSFHRSSSLGFSSVKFLHVFANQFYRSYTEWSI